MTLPILYSSVHSPHCLKIAMFLHEKGIAFDRVEIDLRGKEQKTPAYLRINPMGMVPVYVDDYGVHIDSLLIMHYLEWRYPEPALFPIHDEDFVAALEWIERSSNDFRNVSHHLYWQLIEPPAAGTDTLYVAKLMAHGFELLTRLESQLVGKEMVLGTFGVVDVALIPWVQGYLRFDGLLDGDRFPNVMKWVQRVSERDSFRVNYQQVGRVFKEI